MGRTPWSARVSLDPLYAKGTNSPLPNRPTGASAADPGVRPTQRKLPRTAGDFQVVVQQWKCLPFRVAQGLLGQSRGFRGPRPQNRRVVCFQRVLAKP